MSLTHGVELDSPGFSFKSLLMYNCKKKSALIKLLPEGMYETLQCLEPNIENSEKLADLVEATIDPNEIFLNQALLKTTINLLPKIKASELCENLGVDERGNPFHAITGVMNKASSIQKIKHFFGVREEESARGVYQPPEECVRPTYGLFEYQRAIAIRANAMLKLHPYRCVLHMPTGSGKTRTAMHIIANHINSQNGTVVIWLSQSLELLEQAVDEFIKAWESLGNRSIKLIRFWGNADVNLHEISDAFVVAGFSKMSSWSRRCTSQFLKFADNTSLVVVDEAHQTIAESYSQLVSILSNKKPTTMLLGLTATPGRTWSDISADRELSNYFSRKKLVLEVKGYANPVAYLIDAGYLAKPTFHLLPVDPGNSVGEHTRHSIETEDEIDEGILEGLGRDAVRNSLIVETSEELTKRHKRILVFCPSVTNAHMLSAIMRLRGIEAYCVTANTPLNVRSQSIQKYKGETDKPVMLFNYGVLSTGFDAPRTSALIVARPTRSLVLYSQMIGRAIRGTKAGGNTTAEIYTVVDTSLPGFGSIAEAFFNWEDAWTE